MNVSRVAFSISILLTFPIECFVAREVIIGMILAFHVIFFCHLFIYFIDFAGEILTDKKGQGKDYLGD